MRSWTRALVVGALVLFGGLAPVWAEDYPQRAITIIVPYPPGATADIIARLVGQKLKDALGQSVVVDNRGGASGNIGTALVARAAPDGYTLLIGNDATHATNVFLYRDIGFDPVESFAPITLAAQNIIGLAANPALPATDIAGLIAYARAHPGALAFGSSGAGSPHHLAGELLQQMTGISMSHVPYRGGGPAVADLLGNQIPLVFASLAGVVPYLSAGKLKVLAVVETQRYAPLPEIPTIGETVPGFELSSWLGFFAPAGTPAAVMALLNKSMVAALRSDDVRAKLEPAGLAVIAGTQEGFADVIRRDLDRRREIIRAGAIKVD
jgi:tripartite-type tricarboxylate transporter receptor subunit TctC